MKAKILGFLAVGLLAGPMAVQAVPVSWSVDYLTLTDGSTVSGGFVYDADGDTTSNINITLSVAGQAGSPFSLTNRFYPTIGGAWFLFTETAAADYTGQATLWIVVQNALTNAGGTSPINTGIGFGWGFCTVASCFSATNPGDLRGYLAAVPEPGTLALLGLGLAGLGLSRRRRAN